MTKATLISVILFILVMLIACSPTTQSQPEGATNSSSSTITSSEAAVSTIPAEPEPTRDTPTMSKEESAALIWNKLPNELPQGYQKSQFQPSTGNAIYIENGKWEYNVYGEAITTRQLPINYLETTPGYWVENRSQEVTTRKLLLKTEYFENTGILNLPNVQVTSENTSTEILSQTPIDVFKLKLNWIRGVTDGYNLRLEGSVTNIGLFDLQDVVFEVTTYDFEGKFVRTDTITLTPSKIEVDQIATFSLSITGADLKQGPTGTPEQGNYGGYNYRFLTSTGQEITLQK